jgi:hemolysin-activating ACP:hemolysin acyltransferase
MLLLSERGVMRIVRCKCSLWNAQCLHYEQARSHNYAYTLTPFVSNVVQAQDMVMAQGEDGENIDWASGNQFFD